MITDDPVITPVSERVKATEAAWRNSRVDGANGYTATAMPLEDILLLLRYSLDFFEYFFLGDAIDLATPQFHRDNWALMTAPYNGQPAPQKPRMALAWPRGYAKSTLAKLSIMYMWLFSPISFAAYTSSTHGVALAACRDIVDMLFSENFVAVFGTPKFSIQQDSAGLYIFKIFVPSEAGGFAEKECVLRAFGAKQQIRGTLIKNKRPEYGVADDIEDNDDVRSETNHNTLINWFYGPYVKAFARKQTRHLVLGNMLSTNSLLWDLVECSPEWIGRRFGCIKSDGTPLWPEQETIEDIAADYAEHKRISRLCTWFAEKMNQPAEGEDSLIRSDEIKYLPPILPEQATYCFVTVDPAISEKSSADDRALAVHAYADNQWRTVDYMVGRFSLEQTFFNIVQLCYKWNTRVVCVEAVAFQMVLKTLFEIYMVKYKQPFHFVPILTHNKPKLERIEAWCSLLRTGEWAIQRGLTLITSQLLSFLPSSKRNVDDLIDSCALSVSVLEEHRSELSQKYSQNFPTNEGPIESSYSICPV